MRKLFLTEYITTWDNFVGQVRLMPLNGVPHAMEVTRLLASADSPLAKYLRSASSETTLVPPATEPSALDKMTQGAKKAKDDIAKLVDPQAAPAAAGGPVERMVDDHFAELHRMVQGTPAPIDEMGKVFADAYAQLQAVDAALKSKSPPPPGGGGAEKLKAIAAQQAEPVRSMLVALADVTTRQGSTAERSAMTGDLKPIFDFCTRAIANRYPFAAGSRADVLPEDFGQLFGAGGMLDDFYQKNLVSRVDTSTNPWSYKPLPDGTRSAAPAAIADFQRASRIKDAFFRSGGRAPSFRLDLRALEMSDGLKEVSMDIDGQVHKFSPGNSTPLTVTWPSQRVASQIKLTSTPGGSPQVFEGPWALFRMFDRFDVQPSGQPERFTVAMNLDGRRMLLEVTANSVLSPFRMREMQQFRCPGAL